MVMTGLEGNDPSTLWSDDAWTLTMPVLPPLVVTRMDWESRIHTVFSSCLGSVCLSCSVDAALAVVVMGEWLGMTACGVVARGLMVWTALKPVAFRFICC